MTARNDLLNSQMLNENYGKFTFFLLPILLNPSGKWKHSGMMMVLLEPT